jgi:hypothetical protein
MDQMWDQLLQLVCSARTAEGLDALVSTGVPAVLAVGLIMIVVAIIWQIPQAWRQVLAEKRAKHLEKPVASDGCDPAPPSDDDLPPTSDI